MAAHKHKFKIQKRDAPDWNMGFVCEICDKQALIPRTIVHDILRNGVNWKRSPLARRLLQRIHDS